MRLLGLGLVTGIVLSAGCATTQTQQITKDEPPIVVPQVESEQVESTETEVVESTPYQDRIVSEEKGIFVRTVEGVRLKAVSKGTTIRQSRLLEPTELPANISGSDSLSKYAWAQGDLNGQLVLFAWDFTAAE